MRRVSGPRQLAWSGRLARDPTGKAPGYRTLSLTFDVRLIGRALPDRTYRINLRLRPQDGGPSCRTSCKCIASGGGQVPCRWTLPNVGAE
ncbi:hypothetical protein [Bordetella genomosp. 11]|uniref:hypothetical protein n=1 Tax=Bordetella genomosp. 11 TaxID=1416808 RepID=UPI003F7EDEB5